ncbi:MAG: hypothetical protein IMF05_05135 [Proteobacteria bacterium]|nr:hypothetical protein [Pseudomonadota bacterium]
MPNHVYLILAPVLERVGDWRAFLRGGIEAAGAPTGRWAPLNSSRTSKRKPAIAWLPASEARRPGSARRRGDK